MAFSTLKNKDYFAEPTLYTGNGTTGHAITGVGLPANLTWQKKRSSTGYWGVYDTVRGATNYLSFTVGAEGSNANTLQSWQADGFTVGTDGDMNSSGATMVAYNWKMGTTSGISGGTITPSSYSINTTAKQGVYKYTGNGSAGATVPHGLGAVPSLILVKKYASSSWMVYHASEGPTKVGYFNDTVAFGSGTNVWNSVTPTTSLITLGADGDINGSGGTYMMYTYCNVKGYFRAGVYMANGNANGPTVYTGFKPSLIIIKRRDSSGAWYTWDSKREGYNNTNDEFFINTTAAEGTGNLIDLYGNGFKILSSDAALNSSEQKYVYMAWGENPIVGSGGVPGLSR